MFWLCGAPPMAPRKQQRPLLMGFGATGQKRSQRFLSGYPPGPADLEEFALWPEQHWKVLSRERPQSVGLWRSLLEPGTLNYGDYSGWEGPREITLQLSKGIAYALPDEPWAQHVEFKFTRSCDNAALPQKALLHQALCLDEGPHYPAFLWLCFHHSVVMCHHCVVMCLHVPDHLLASNPDQCESRFPRIRCSEVPCISHAIRFMFQELPVF